MTDNTSTKRQQKRREVLNKAAIGLGYTSWSAYETAVVRNYLSQETHQENTRQSSVIRGRITKTSIKNKVRVLKINP